MIKSEVIFSNDLAISRKQEAELMNGFNRTVCLPTQGQLTNHSLVTFSDSGATADDMYVVEYQMSGISGGVRSGISCYLNRGSILSQPAAPLAEILHESGALVIPYMVDSLNASLLLYPDRRSEVISALRYTPNSRDGYFELYVAPEQGISWKKAYEFSGLTQVVERGRVYQRAGRLTTVTSPYLISTRGAINMTKLGINTDRQALRWMLKGGSSVTLTSRAIEDWHK